MNTVFGNFWGIHDNELFLKSVHGIFESTGGADGFHSSDQLITFGRNLTFMFHEEFIQSFTRHAISNSEKSTIWRKAVHYWAGSHCIHLDGDFVECGTYTGTTVHIIFDALNFDTHQKTYWLYDIFDFNDGDKHQKLKFLGPELYEEVVKRFSFTDKIKIIQGYVPDSFQKGTPDRIALLHIDFNNPDAELAALEELWPKVVQGGIVLLDDFGWKAYSAQTNVELDFFKKRNYSILEIPTGQGLVIKR
jgi:O-methyltransferase